MQHEPAVLRLFRTSLHLQLAALSFGHCSRCIVPPLVRTEMADRPIKRLQFSRDGDQLWCFSPPSEVLWLPPSVFFYAEWFRTECMNGGEKKCRLKPAAPAEFAASTFLSSQKEADWLRNTETWLKKILIGAWKGACCETSDSKSQQSSAL